MEMGSPEEALDMAGSTADSSVREHEGEAVILAVNLNGLQHVHSDLTGRGNEELGRVRRDDMWLL